MSRPITTAYVDVMIRVAVHHAVEACKAATGQHRVIDYFVNKTHIANEVMQAIRETAAEAAPAAPIDAAGEHTQQAKWLAE